MEHKNPYFKLKREVMKIATAEPEAKRMKPSAVEPGPKQVNNIESQEVKNKYNNKSTKKKFKYKKSGNKDKGSSGDKGSSETKVKCSHCGFTNHSSEECRNTSGCFICHKRGHIGRFCPTKTNSNNKAGNEPPSMYKVNLSNEEDIDRNIVPILNRHKSRKQVIVHSTALGGRHFTKSY